MEHKLIKSNGYPTKLYVRKILWRNHSDYLRYWKNPVACYYPELGKMLVEVANYINQNVKKPK